MIAKLEKEKTHIKGYLMQQIDSLERSKEKVLEFFEYFLEISKNRNFTISNLHIITNNKQTAVFNFTIDIDNFICVISIGADYQTNHVIRISAGLHPKYEESRKILLKKIYI